MPGIHISDCETYLGDGGTDAPAIYVIDAPEHPFDMVSLARGRVSTIVRIPVSEWRQNLTPWPAEALYRGEPDFGGEAAATLGELIGETIPGIEARDGLVPIARGVCGYSLGGLFALYALTHTSVFSACGCVSGSVWYEGWVDHLRELDRDLAGTFAYLSLGTKERRAARPLLKAVQDRMEDCAAILTAKGCVVDYRTGPGNHLQHIHRRVDTALGALDSFLTGKGGVCPTKAGQTPPLPVPLPE